MIIIKRGILEKVFDFKHFKTIIPLLIYIKYNHILNLIVFLMLLKDKKRLKNMEKKNGM